MDKPFGVRVIVELSRLGNRRRSAGAKQREQQLAHTREIRLAQETVGEGWQSSITARVVNPLIARRGQYTR